MKRTTQAIRTKCCLLLAALLGLGGCRQTDHSPLPAAGYPTVPAAGLPATSAGPSPSGEGVQTAVYQVEGEPLVGTTVVGEPAVFNDNLAIFPIYSRSQPLIGPVTSLDAALASGVAEVRELGASGPPAPLPQQPAVEQQQAQQPAVQQAQQPAQYPQQPAIQLSSGAEVGKLVIDNRGDVPIYVLAGTVVKGGKQDRQIGQDFIIGARQQVGVDAFCVEHGRWSGQRKGVDTGGKFKTMKQLATADVRAAGQYEGNQGKVWQKVSAINKAHSKASATGSLLASLDDEEIRRQRDELSRKILRNLSRRRPAGALVGFAYAVGGQVKGARWFVNHEVFKLFQEALVNTAAVDAITAAAEAGPGGAVAAPLPQAVALFVKQVEASRQQKIRQTSAQNDNWYSESDQAFGSKTLLKRKGKPAVNVSSDFVSK